MARILSSIASFSIWMILYSCSTGMAQYCRNNINEFLMQRFGLTVEDASKLRVDLFRTYGSSLAGLRALGYDIDPDEYHSFVHGRLPYEVIKPDAELRDILKSIKKRKLVGKATKSKEADYAIDSIHDLHAVIPRISEVNDIEAAVASDYQIIACKQSEGSNISTTTLVHV